MAYTTKDDVLAMFRDLKVEATGTAVVEATLTNWIARQDAYINARLSEYYVTPITGAESLKIVNLIASYKVAHMIKGVLELTSSNSDMQQDVQGNLDKKAEEMLDKLLPKKGKNGEIMPPLMELIDASKKPSSPKNASGLVISTSGPTFTKNGNNW